MRGLHFLPRPTDPWKPPNKADAGGLEAFMSPRFGNLAEMGVDIKLYKHRLREPPHGRFRLHTISVTDILVIWVVPGFSDDFMQPLVESKTLRGLVLMLYGCGTTPVRKKLFLNNIKKLVEDGVTVTACSQCQIGTVALDRYAVGQALVDAGVVSGGDMTVEAAVTKMAYLLSKDLSPEDVRTAMCKNVRGELTTDEDILSLREPVTGCTGPRSSL